MVTPADVAVTEVFVFALVTAGYLPVLSAYARDPRYKWLLAGYTALLLGRAITVLEEVVSVPGLNLLEHGIGVGLAGVLLAVHARQRYRDVIAGRGTDRSLEEHPLTEER